MTSTSATSTDEPSVVYDGDIAAMYDNDSYGIYRASHDDVLAMIPRDRRYERVLDVGAGTGTVLQRVTETFQPTTVFGLDPSPAMLELASKKVPDMVHVVADDAALVNDTRLRELDLVLANFVLAYSPPEQLIARVRAVLKPGGTFAVTTTTMNSFQELYRLSFHPIFRIISSGYDISPETAEANLPPLPKDPADLCRRLTEGGFEVVEVRTRQHTIRFKNGRALYDFGREGGWWLDLFQRLSLTSRSVPWMHLGLRACQLLGLIDKQCTTTMETCSVIARRPIT